MNGFTITGSVSVDVEKPETPPTTSASDGFTITGTCRVTVEPPIAEPPTNIKVRYLDRRSRFWTVA